LLRLAAGGSAVLFERGLGPGPSLAPGARPVAGGAARGRRRTRRPPPLLGPGPQGGKPAVLFGGGGGGAGAGATARGPGGGGGGGCEEHPWGVCGGRAERERPRARGPTHRRPAGARAGRARARERGPGAGAGAVAGGGRGGAAGGDPGREQRRWASPT